jgi:GMP reductase
MSIKLDFDDVLIVPQFTDVTSRSQVELARTIHGRWGSSITGVPIVAANMDGVGTFQMNRALAQFGMFTAIVKHRSYEEWKSELEELSQSQQSVENNLCITIGMSDEDLNKAMKISTLLKSFGVGTPKIVIDVANGYMNPFYDFIKKVRDGIPNAFIMAGTVVTSDAVERVIESGADIARVGIGTGAVCTTRRVAGVGYPQFSALVECAPAADSVGGGVMSDGGCVYAGDFAKAFGAGAEMVMAGSIFAGHDESGCEIRDGKVTFYGMSSRVAQETHGTIQNYRTSEGRVVQIPYKGLVEHTVTNILGGIRSACAYVNALNLQEFSEQANFIQVNKQLNTSLEKYTI